LKPVITQPERQVLQPAFADMSRIALGGAFVFVLASSVTDARISLQRDAAPEVTVSDTVGSAEQETYKVAGGGSQAASQLGEGGAQAASTAARSLPRVPNAPLPSVNGPRVEVLGSSKPHTADPVVCGLLGGVIVLNWILACCCAGFGAAGAGAAAAEAEQGDTKDAEAAGAAGGVCGALFACVECLASICSLVALVYCIATGLFRAWMGGQAVSGWCLAVVVLSTLQLILCCCICCCASCGAAILGEEMHEKYVNKHSRHLMGAHMHDLVHKHKPDGTHPIHEGHVPVVGHPLGKKGKDAPQS